MPLMEMRIRNVPVIALLQDNSGRVGTFLHRILFQQFLRREHQRRPLRGHRDLLHPRGPIGRNHVAAASLFVGARGFSEVFVLQGTGIQEQSV